MKSPKSREEFFEPERYELDEEPSYQFQMNRREFGQTLGAGIVISVASPGLLAQRSRGRRVPMPSERLHIGQDGIITVLTGKVEVGQGSRTQITQAAAEELGVPADSIRVVMADSAIVPDDGGTAGSRTTPSTLPEVRKACAAAREFLMRTAIEKYDDDRALLSVSNGQVIGLKADSKFGYADLADQKVDSQSDRKDDPNGGAKPTLSHLTSAQVSKQEVKPVSEWKVMGASLPKVNAHSIVTGTHRYASDLRLPGMLYGTVIRPPSWNAELISIDLTAAQNTQDVIAVHDGNFSGVAAPSTFEAGIMADKIAATARWKEVEQMSSEQLYPHLRTHSSVRRPRQNRKGNPEQALKEADKVLKATYQVPYIQHAPMEPRAALAEWKDGNLTVWTGTQQPSRVRSQLAEAFRINSSKVRLVVPDTGGGFGGKHTGEAAVEAARLAKAAGKPVSLRWTREEEFTWAYFRPAGVMELSAGLDSNGNLIAWRHVNYNSGGSAIATPYEVADVMTEFRYCDQPLRSGSYRALSSTANAFARECFMDELAAVNEVDPLDFRLKHLRNERLGAVLKAAAKDFDWVNSRKRIRTVRNIGVGIGCGIEKGSYVAACAEVEVNASNGHYRVIRISQAFECGAIINPANLTAQNEGSIIQGLGAVLNEEIRFDNGRISNPRFSEYKVPRFSDIPDISVVLVNRSDLPSVGGSETPIIAVAPAVGNALFETTGVRFRSLPLKNEQFRSA